MKNKPLVIIGSGQQASLVWEAAELQNFQIELQLTEENEKQYLTDEEFCHSHTFIIAIGDNQTRKDVSGTYKNLEYGNVIHPEAFVSPSAKLGRGIFVGPKAVIHTNAVIGNHCIINTSSVIEHDCIIGDFTHVAPSATLTGSVIVGDVSLIGAGATVAPGAQIPKHHLVKAGSVFKGDL